MDASALPAMPTYQLLMQERIYGQGWAVTLLEYFVPGSAYLVLVAFAAVFAGLSGRAGP